MLFIENPPDPFSKQTSRHNPPEKPLPDIPSNVTHVYTCQHKTTGLQCHYEGPFKIANRESKSVVKIEVGVYADGTKRYELRHLNDLKLAHPDSLAAPAQRPKLGRPSTARSGGSNQTESDPEPPSSFSAERNKQIRSTGRAQRNEIINHETSTPEDRQPASEGPMNSGPPSTPPFPASPVRSTRNLAPYYALNQSIGG